MSEAKPIGDVLDALGVTALVEDGELVVSAVVVLRVIEVDGDERITLVHSDGQGWVERMGMLRAAEQVEVRDITPRQ